MSKKIKKYQKIVNFTVFLRYFVLFFLIFKIFFCNFYAKTNQNKNSINNQKKLIKKRNNLFVFLMFKITNKINKNFKNKNKKRA